VSDELLGTIDDRIADERLDTLARGDTLQRRALTVLSEAMMIARGHMAAVAEGRVIARPQLLKVAVDAAAEVRQVVSARSAVGQTGSTVNVNITKNQATIIQGAFRESGVDLSDVLDGVFVVPTSRTVKE
jgi:alpha-D-ribose 1-methylphosphonate 5-phosphate C-P lyase